MEKLSDAMNLVFIELGRFDKSIEMLENDKERFYFCMKHMAEFTRIPEEFEGNVVMEELFQTTAVESLSKSDKIKYISFMTTERDRRNQEIFALEKSYNEGLEKGIEKGRAELIRNLKAAGMSDAQIGQMAGISEEELARILG